MLNFKSKRSEFIKIVREKYPEKIKKGRLKLISFDSVDRLPEKFFVQIGYPGIFGIHCFGSNHSCIDFSLNVFWDIATMFSELNDESLEDPSGLLKDFQLYGLKSMVFIIFDYGLEWENFNLLLKEWNLIKSSWPYEIYSDCS